MMQVLRPCVVILSLMAASYIDQFYDGVLWCVMILNLMAASYAVEFYDRVPGYRVSWSLAKLSSELTACQNVLRYCVYRKCFREKKSLIYNSFRFKENISSLKMNKITVVELKAITKQRGIKGYYKLRKAELIHKFEALPDVNEKVLLKKMVSY